mmetsp:Transcript_38655/g.69276  ORF Transcript_38655/g.69276 Transcript_38655/m.69276 type:complete len:203 (-) Transcript_38655:555-1163(-)
MRSESSMTVTGRCRWFLNVFITRSASLYRSSPLSTNTQCRRSPMTLWTSVAATAESTPPERAQMTWSSGPTFAATLAISCSNTSSIFHVFLSFAISNRKCRSVSVPWSVCITSGWYCSPYMRAFTFSIATIAPCWLLATASKPGGSLMHSSPWLIHTSCRLDVWLPYSSDPSSMCIGMRPYSPPSTPTLTSPPSVCTSSCIP